MEKAIGETAAPPDTARPALLTVAGVRRQLGAVALLAAFVIALLFAVPGLRGVLHAVAGVSPWWVGLAVALEVASCTSFVVVFRIFFNEIPVGPARELAWAEMGTGALLPGGGAGGLAVGGWLMHLAGMPTRRIVERSSGLFFLTSAINVLALAAGAFLLAAHLASGPHGFLLAQLPLVVAVITLAAGCALPAVGRRRRAAWGTSMLDGLRGARSELRHPGWRLAGAFGYLGFDIAVLWATFSATGKAPPVAALVLAYLIGYLANVVPLPGGVGALDAGLAGALVLYGAPATQAGAAVLVYHAIAFWIPGLGGVVGYLLVRHRLSDTGPQAAAANAGPSTTSAPAALLDARRNRRSCLHPRAGTSASRNRRRRRSAPSGPSSSRPRR